MSVINTNTKAIVAQNAMTSSNRAMSKAMEQLSTGKRINSAADDAAGLAISSKMTSQIKGLNQAVRNANDGISLLQTAEGATVEMSNMLQRMRELAVQSATDTNTSSDRSYLNLEYKQLGDEIARISNTTQWNGMNILNNSTTFGTGGTFADPSSNGTDLRNIKIQVGANADQTISAAFKNFSFTNAGVAAATTASVGLSSDDLSAVDAIEVKIGTTTFTKAITSTAAAVATNTEATGIASALQTEIRTRVGFESVTVTSVGNSLEIKDSQGRAISDLKYGTAGTFAAATAGGFTAATASTPTPASTPNVNDVFGGDARINNTDITTQASSNTAIGKLDNALNNIGNERAKFGAIINRLTYAADNLTNVSQNTSASRSQVLDTDYAQATTELARTQIISQAATAMLAQANQAPQSVLSLLR
jgi:flagellin